MKVKFIFFISSAVLILFAVIFFLVRKEKYNRWLQNKINTGVIRADSLGHPPFLAGDALTYWLNKKTSYETMIIDSNEVVFFGDSEIERFQWPGIKNLGISGDNLQGGLLRIGDAIKGKPKKVFIELGTNNIGLTSQAEFERNYKKLILKIRESSPATRIYIFSLLPKKASISILEINTLLKSLAIEMQCTFIPVYVLFDNGNGEIDTSLTRDGIHPDLNGYKIWWNAIQKYVKE